MLLRTLNAVFDDKRIMVAMVWCWLIVVLCVFTEMVREPHPTPKSEQLLFTQLCQNLRGMKPIPAAKQRWKCVRCLCHNVCVVCLCQKPCTRREHRTHGPRIRLSQALISARTGRELDCHKH